MKTTKKIIALVLLASVFTFCKKDDPEPEPEPEPVAPVVTTGVNSAPQAQFVIEGVTYTYESGKDSIVNVKSNDKVVINATSKKAIYHSALTRISKTRFKVSKNWLVINNDKYPAEASFKNYFLVSSVPYATLITEGIRLSWIDNTGKEWATDKGAGDQSTSIFKIESNKEVKNAYQEMVIFATFNCKLYDDNGNSKTLTNGKFVGAFENN